MGTARKFLHPMKGNALDAIPWLLRDEFNDTRAAGAVNNTPATPGPGTRVVVDTDGDAVSVGVGALTFANPNGAWTHGLWYGGIARTIGRVVLTRIVIPTLTGKYFTFGWDGNQTGVISELSHYLDNGVLNAREGASSPFLTPGNGIDLYLALVVRGGGGYFFYKQVGGWTLGHIKSLDATTPHYPAFSNYNFVGGIDFIRIPVATWNPPLLAYTTFTQANGAL